MNASSGSLSRGTLIGNFGLLATVLGTLAGEATGWAPLHWLAWAGLGLYLADAWRHVGGKGHGFMVGALLMIGLSLIMLDQPQGVLADGLGRAAFIATLFTALGILREAATTSDLVRRCGLFLAGQPPGRRYAALTVGAHLFSIILNFGSVALLGALIERSLEGDRSERGRLRERRMMTAIHRGFSTILAWSPLTVSMAVVLTALPDSDWAAVAPWGLATAAALTTLGWLIDRAIRPPRHLMRSGPRPRPDGSWTLILPIVGLVGGVFVVGFVLETALDVRLVTGVMMAAPVIAAAWLFGQTGTLRATAGRLGDHVTIGFAAYRMELAILSSAAFIGSLIGALLPEAAVSAAIAAVPLPAWGLVAGLAWIIVGLGQLGLNPVLSVSAVAGALPAPAVLGLPPEAVAVALTGAWALTAASSPVAASSLIIGSMTGVGPGVAGRRWNGPYALAGLVIVTIMVGIVAAVAG